MTAHLHATTLTGRGARRLEVPPCRILVADDDGEMRELIRRALAGDGYEVEIARDGTDLVDRLTDSQLGGGGEAPYDLVITDVRMPGWSGLQVLAGLGGLDAPSFILITAFGDAALHEQARRLGAAAILDKPFDLDDLRSVVCHVASHGRGPA